MLMIVANCGILLMQLSFIFKLSEELGRLIERVNCDSEAIIEEFRDDSSQQRTANLQTRIRIRFNEEDFKVFVDHEVVSKDLKAVRDALRVNLGAYSSERVCDEALHLREEIPHEAHIFASVVCIEIPLEVID